MYEYVRHLHLFDDESERDIGFSSCSCDKHNAGDDVDVDGVDAWFRLLQEKVPRRVRAGSCALKREGGAECGHWSPGQGRVESYITEVERFMSEKFRLQRA